MMTLDAYFDRIGYDGDQKPSLDVLRRLHLLHTQSIPFENLSPFLGMEVRLDIPSLLDKFTRQGRGGYCYEHNVLFRHVLQALGFRTKGLAARVRMNVPDSVVTPRSHMLLLVEIDGEQYIADTGFGGMTLTAPLRLEPGIEQDTPHGPFRLLQGEASYKLEAKVGEDWKTLYMFDLVEHFLPDYEVSNWYLSNHPRSHFVTGLIAALPAEDGRHALSNNRYSFYGLDGRQEKKMLETAGELKDVLEHVFRLGVADLPGIGGKFENLARPE